MPGVGHSSRERRNSKTVPGEESSITVNSVCVDPTGDRDTPCDEAARFLVQAACWSLQEMKGSACCMTSAKSLIATEGCAIRLLSLVAQI